MINELRHISQLASEILMINFKKLSDHSIVEKAAHDFVTNVDRESEKLITSLLIENFPDIPVFGEEFGWSSKSNSELYWVIDPLDGTKNYIQQIPYFCISIALIKNGQPVVGAIYDPVHKDFFYSEKSKGALLNDEKIGVSNRAKISDGFIATGFPFRTRKLMNPYFESFKDIFERISNMRRCGSAALDLSYVAAGRYDAFFENGLKEWDMAAGVLLIQEAGGIVSDFFNQDNFLKKGHIVAGAKHFHELILKQINNHFKPEDFLNV